MDVEAPAGDRGATGDEDPARREYWALESGQVVDQLGIVTTTRVQLVTFLGTANILVLGTALSVSKAGLCLVASAIAVLMFVLDARLGFAWRLLHVRGIVQQRRLSNDEPDTFLQLSAHGAGRVEKAIREPDATKRATMVERSSTYHLNSLHAQIPLAIAVVEGFGVFLALTPSFDLF
jgi:hypothetical protein